MSGDRCGTRCRPAVQPAIRLYRNRNRPTLHAQSAHGPIPHPWSTASAAIATNTRRDRLPRLRATHPNSSKPPSGRHPNPRLARQLATARQPAISIPVASQCALFHTLRLSRKLRFHDFSYALSPARLYIHQSEKYWPQARHRHGRIQCHPPDATAVPRRPMR